MKSSNFPAESRRLLDFVPSIRPSFLSVVLVFVCGCLWVKNETTNERLILLERWNLALTFSPAFRVSRLKILTGYLFHRQKLQQEIFIRRFRHMYPKGSVIHQVKSSLQMLLRCRYMFRTDFILFWFRHIIFHGVSLLLHTGSLDIA